MCYWPSLCGRDGWILAELFFALMEKQTKERGQYFDILTEQAIYKKQITL